MWTLEQGLNANPKGNSKCTNDKPQINTKPWESTNNNPLWKSAINPNQIAAIKNSLCLLMRGRPRISWSGWGTDNLRMEKAAQYKGSENEWIGKLQDNPSSPRENIEAGHTIGHFLLVRIKTLIQCQIRYDHTTLTITNYAPDPRESWYKLYHKRLKWKTQATLSTHPEGFRCTKPWEAENQLYLPTNQFQSGGISTWLWEVGKSSPTSTYNLWIPNLFENVLASEDLGTWDLIKFWWSHGGYGALAMATAMANGFWRTFLQRFHFEW